MMEQEPWCGFPADVALLTDWQIQTLYAKPAIERAKQFESERARQLDSEPYSTHRQSPIHDDTTHPEIGTPDFRKWVINQFLKVGMTYQDAVKQYEAQAKDFKG